MLPALATRDQWMHFWGGSDVQRVGKFFEVSAVAFLGLWGCYFTSFFLGVGTMSLIGAVRKTSNPPFLLSCCDIIHNNIFPNIPGFLEMST